VSEWWLSDGLIMAAMTYEEWKAAQRDVARRAIREHAATGSFSAESQLEMARLARESVLVHLSVQRAFLERLKAELGKGSVSRETKAEMDCLADGKRWAMNELNREFEAAGKEMQSPKSPAQPMTPVGAMFGALNVMPGTEYHGWVFAVGIPSTIVAGFAASTWVLTNGGFTSYGVFAVVCILGFAITGWLAKKR
jgi:hypothetical protein